MSNNYREAVESESDSDEFSSSSSSDEEHEEQEEEENQSLRPQQAPQLQENTPVKDVDKEGLSDTEKLQLVTDIVEAGGLDNIGQDKHPLSRLLVEKADNYALHLPEKKRQIQNKVNHWKSSKKGREEYQSFLRSSQTSPSPNRRSSKTPHSLPTPRRKPKTSSRKTPDSSRRKKEISSPCSSGLCEPPTVQRTIYRSPEDLHFDRPRQPYIRPFEPVPTTLPMSSTERTLLNSADLVNVNIGFPEKNGNVMVYSFENLLQGTDKVLRTGYILEIQSVDRRWMEDLEAEAIEAWQVAPNEVLLKQPSTSYAYLHAAEEESKGKTLANFDNTVILQATDVPRNAIIADEGRQFRYTRFVFPKDLDNSVFSPNAERGKIAPKIVPLVTQLAYKGPDVNGDEVEVAYEGAVNVNVNFTICLLEKNKRTMEVKKKVNALKEQMQSLNLLPTPLRRAALPPPSYNAALPPPSYNAAVPRNVPSAVAAAPVSSAIVAAPVASAIVPAPVSSASAIAPRKAPTEEQDANKRKKKKPKVAPSKNETEQFEVQEEIDMVANDEQPSVLLQNDRSVWTGYNDQIDSSDL